MTQLSPEGIVAIILSILGTVGFVVRSNRRNKARILDYELQTKERENTLRTELMRDAREAQLKLEKYQESARAAALEERNATIVEQHKLSDRLINNQEMMLRLQTELREAEQKERESKERATLLLNELTRTKESLETIQRQLTSVQAQLDEATKRIGQLQQENTELKTEISKIKKNATQPLQPVDMPNLS